MIVPSLGASTVDHNRLLEDHSDQCQRYGQSGEWSEWTCYEVRSRHSVDKHRKNKEIADLMVSDGYGAVNGFPAAPNSFSDSFNADAAIEELDNIRLREITGKAISGSLLLMLKWFKRSRKLQVRGLCDIVSNRL